MEIPNKLISEAVELILKKHVQKMNEALACADNNRLFLTYEEVKNILKNVYDEVVESSKYSNDVLYESLFLIASFGIVPIIEEKTKLIEQNKLKGTENGVPLFTKDENKTIQ